MSSRKQVKRFSHKVNVEKQAVFCRDQKTACFLFMCLLALTAMPVQADLVGHWKLDEASGLSAYDSSGNGYTGTLQNMSGTEWSIGAIDGALTLDGTNDYISVPRVSALEDGNAGTHHISASVWINALCRFLFFL